MIPPDYSDPFDVAGQQVTIRTMHPADRRIEAEFVNGLSQKSRYQRFHGAMRELPTKMLDRFTHPDYPDEMALIATITENGEEREIGVARYARTTEPGHAEVAIVVSDEWHGKGIGTRLLRDLRELAMQAGYRHLEVSILSDNKPMLELARELGFENTPSHSGYPEITLGKGLDQ